MATIKDIVLIHLEDSPVSFARVEDIQPDHKKDWYQIKLLMLQIPLQVVTWILKDAYINGDDFFMNGKKMRLETVVCPGEEALIDADEDLDMPAPSAVKQRPEDSDTPPKKTSGDSRGKIISFSDLKNSRKSDPGDEPEPDIG